MMLDFAVEVAREAGEILMSGYGRVERQNVGYKGWRNLVTEIDLAVEQHVARRIMDRFPTHGILSEERISKEPTPGEVHRWVVDPLDGTTNFVHSHPFFCVSIGLERGVEGVVGVVWAPVLEEMFTADEGTGAALNGAACSVSAELDISHALLASGFAYGQDRNPNTNLENWGRMSLVTRGLRRCGSAALDLCYVACGRYEGFWELYLGPWDCAAGAVLVRAAGGRVTDLQCGDTWRDGHEILATNGHLHEEIRCRLTGPDAAASREP
jgi:myo-inositol-1(or 4)-monophosphatase